MVVLYVIHNLIYDYISFFCCHDLCKDPLEDPIVTLITSDPDLSV